jgi:hypothetical protein
MDSNSKIDMINAYRLLQGQPLKLGKSTTETVTTAVNTEFQTWVSLRVEELLGNTPESKSVAIPAAQLSEDDVDVLVVLIENVRSKQKLNTVVASQQGNAPTSPPVRRVKIGPDGIPEPRGMRGNPNARPLVDGPTRPSDPDPDGMKRRNGQAMLLRELASMESAYDPDAGGER